MESYSAVKAKWYDLRVEPKSTLSATAQSQED